MDAASPSTEIALSTTVIGAVMEHLGYRPGWMGKWRVKELSAFGLSDPAAEDPFSLARMRTGAARLIERLTEQARRAGINLPYSATTAYIRCTSCPANANATKPRLVTAASTAPQANRGEDDDSGMDESSGAQD